MLSYSGWLYVIPIPIHPCLPHCSFQYSSCDTFIVHITFGSGLGLRVCTIYQFYSAYGGYKVEVCL